MRLIKKTRSKRDCEEFSRQASILASISCRSTSIPRRPTSEPSGAMNIGGSRSIWSAWPALISPDRSRFSTTCARPRCLNNGLRSTYTPRPPRRMGRVAGTASSRRSFCTPSSAATCRNGSPRSVAGFRLRRSYGPHEWRIISPRSSASTVPSAFLLTAHNEGRIRLVSERAEVVDRDILTALDPGDILFVDLRTP